MKKPAAAAARYEIVKNTRDYSRETRTGRVVTGMITTWDVVDTRTCGLVGEYYTRREAVAALARYNAAAIADATAVWEAARAAANAAPSKETHAAAIAAWDALGAVTPRQTGGSRMGSRAGRRQAAERRAMEGRR